MTDTLIIMIYILLIIFIIVLIAIGIKLIGTLTRVDVLLDDVTNKVKTLDRVFEFIDVMNDKMSAIGEAIIGFVSGSVKGLFKDKKSKKRKKLEREDEEDE